MGDGRTHQSIERKRIAVISIDKDNFWGYPSARVLERLKKAGVKVYRTDRDGDIVLSIPVAESLE
ncbi:unnamed protein product [marine sediment metagenome]|uniref:Uncharacterized protein n=1 Tax=marine sediment metagenome TaxID=412755 RepID=X1RBZ6_9ZZZZ